jgi:hypothetical protein
MALRTPLLSYLALSSIFLFWHPSGLAKDVFVTPAMVVVSLGLGLAIYRLCFEPPAASESASTLHTWLTSLYLGITAHTLLYQQLERLGILSSVYRYVFPATLIIAVLGLFSRHDICAPMLIRDLRWRHGLIFHVPLLAIAYSFYYLKFSYFPLRDIFQETHFLKGAAELARFHILNPYTADSYIPVLQVHLGLLHDWYGLDLLASQWTTPLLFGCIRYLTLLCLFQALLPNPLPRWIATALAIVTLHNLFSATNGDMVFSVCLLLMAAKMKEDPSTNTSAYIETAALFATAVVLYEISNVQTIGLYWAALAALLALLRTWKQRSEAAGLHLLLAMTAVVLHPAMSLLYLFCALGLVAMHRCLMTSWPQLARSLRTALTLSLMMTTLCLGVLLGRLSWNLYSPDTTAPVLHALGQWLLGKEITGAEGIRNTAIEWIRLAPPALLLLVALLAISQGSGFKLRGQRQTTGGWRSMMVQSAQISPLSIFAWTGALSTLLISFSGLPYVHRALYFPLLMLCLLAAILLALEIERSRKGEAKGLLLKHGIVLLFYLAAAGRYAYKAPDVGGPSPNPYIQALAPLVMVGLVGAICLFLTAFVSKQPKRVSAAFIALVMVVVLSDKLAIKAYGFRYSYGDSWTGDQPISHYTMAEIALAERISRLPANTILLSDPYTLGIIEALTGLNGLYTFSNLGVMREEYKTYLRNVLACFERSAKDPACGTAPEMSRQVVSFLDLYPGAAPEARYVSEKTFNTRLSQSRLEKNVVIILNAGRTLAWATGKEAYFPTMDRFSNEFVEWQRRQGYDVIANVDNSLLALRIR